MTQSDIYLKSIVAKYAPHDISVYEMYSIPNLKSQLTKWASTCFIQIINSGSRAKGTAISIASDVDYLISLTNECNNNVGGLNSIYVSLYNKLNELYPNQVRKQNVSIRVKVAELEIDITPAKKQPGNTNYHSLYVSKLDSWKQTNIQIHINDVSKSGRLNEIKLLKIWRELNQLDFPSIYLEYLLISNVLYGKLKGDDYLANNVWYVLNEFSKDVGNPLFSRVVDPASTTNILSDLLTTAEKNKIIVAAKNAISKTEWNLILW